MKRTVAAVVLAATLTVASPAPADAHAIYCAAYVGNPCYRTAAAHAWFHQLLTNPFGVLFR